MNLYHSQFLSHPPHPSFKVGISNRIFVLFLGMYYFQCRFQDNSKTCTLMCGCICDRCDCLRFTIAIKQKQRPLSNLLVCGSNTYNILNGIPKIQAFCAVFLLCFLFCLITVASFWLRVVRARLLNACYCIVRTMTTNECAIQSSYLFDSSLRQNIDKDIESNIYISWTQKLMSHHSCRTWTVFFSMHSTQAQFMWSVEFIRFFLLAT